MRVRRKILRNCGEVVEVGLLKWLDDLLTPVNPSGLDRPFRKTGTLKKFRKTRFTYSMSDSDEC